MLRVSTSPIYLKFDFLIIVDVHNLGHLLLFLYTFLHSGCC